MDFRHDLAQWRREQLALTYQELAKATVKKNKSTGKVSRLSHTTVWLACEGKGDPTASTIKALFKALKLKPEYALNFQLKRSDFHLAVVNGGKAG